MVLLLSDGVAVIEGVAVIDGVTDGVAVIEGVAVIDGVAVIEGVCGNRRSYWMVLLLSMELRLLMSCGN